MAAKQAIRKEHTRGANASQDMLNGVRGKIYQYTLTGQFYKILRFETPSPGYHEQVVCEDQTTGEIDYLPRKNLENFVPVSRAQESKLARKTQTSDQDSPSDHLLFIT